ncbi:stage V sporulation protein B [Clostridia bacterium]|nr:stage V sporulation protein B [Clostridia bacterium]
MTEKSAGRSFLQGALILSIATALVKIIGAVFKIPLANLIGGSGMAHFNTAYTIYNVLLVISTAGLPVALSKMIAESRARGRTLEIKRIVGVARTAFMAVGLAGAAFMFFMAQPLADLMANEKGSTAIMTLAPAVFFVAMMSVYRGYFQGMSDMVPTAVSQVIEALFKLAVGFSLAWLLKLWGFPMEICAAGGIGGVALGTGLGFVYIYLASKFRGRPKKQKNLEPGGESRSRKRLLKDLVVLAVPITLGASVLSLVNFIDTLLVMNRLQSPAGFSEEAALNLYGSYTGLAQTMFNLPGAFIVTIAVSIIPAISAALARNDHGGAARTIESAMRINMLLSMPAGFGLAALSYPILSLLFFSVPGEVAIASPLLTILGAAVILNAVVLVSNAVLQAYGRVRLPVYSMAIGGAVKIAVNFVLVGDPAININGAPIGTVCCYGVIAVINIGFMIRYSEAKLRLSSVFLRPMIAAAVMAGAAWSVNAALSRVVSQRISVLAAIAVGGILYLILAILIRAVTKEDMRLLPKGEKLAKILRIK